MDTCIIEKFLNAVLAQDGDSIIKYFSNDAYVNWHCTNESFTVEEFIRVNCDYPGEWSGEIERIETAGDTFIVAIHVYSRDRSMSYYVVSFIRTKHGKIVSLDEYWADDCAPPLWRREMQIGRSIK